MSLLQTLLRVKYLIGGLPFSRTRSPFAILLPVPKTRNDTRDSGVPRPETRTRLSGDVGVLRTLFVEKKEK